MAFRDIIGQEKAVDMLAGILRRERLASSYLFSGEPGIGKKTTAINFAKALNCLHTTQRSEEPVASGRGASLPADQDACDECESCVKIGSGAHPDVLFVSPEDRQIRIEEVRLIDEALSFKPFEGRKKVVIVDDAETMNAAAANAFLKTLEEPPEESVIILVSSRPDLLLPTIRSRCSGIKFSPLSFDSCMLVLDGRVAVEDRDLIARLSMGRPGLALSSDFLEERRWFLDLLEGMFAAEKDGWTSREDMERWFEHALTLLRDLAVIKVTDRQASLINEDQREYIGGLSKSADLKGIISLYRELGRLKGLLTFNLNKSITWNYTALLLRKELSSQNA